VVTGSPPLYFLWSKGTNLLAGATNSALLLTDVVPAHSGDYLLTVSSHVGVPLNVLMPLRVLIPPPLQSFSRSEGYIELSFPSVSDQRYFIDETEALGLPWKPWINTFLGDGSVIVFTNLAGDLTKFFRLRVE